MPATQANDPDGNRILTILPGGTKVYTPFPEYEETVPPSGATTQRSSYFLTGQLIAVRVRTGTTGSGALSFAYADHPGSLSAWTTSSGAYIGGSLPDNLICLMEHVNEDAITHCSTASGQPEEREGTSLRDSRARSTT